MEAADREGLQRVDIWCEICHACSKPATWKRGPLMWILPLYLHVNQKSNDDDDDDDNEAYQFTLRKRYQECSWEVSLVAKNKILLCT